MYIPIFSASNFYRFSLLLLVLNLVSCKTIQPIEPTISYATTDYVQPPSLITLPIEIQLDNYLKTAEKNIPTTFKDDKQQCEGVSVSYVFERNPIEIGSATNKLLLELSGKYGIKISYCPKCTNLLNENGNCIVPRVSASCGMNEPMRKIKISTSTALTITSDYKLKSQTTINDVVSEDKCEVTFLKYDATSHLEKEMKKALLDVTKDLDQKIESFALEKEAKKIWNQLNEPIDLGGGLGYFYLSPKKISKSDIQFNASKVQLELQLEAFPKVELEKRETVVEPLPLIENSQSTDGFNIHLDIKGLYSSFNEILKKNSDQKEVTLKKNKLIIDSVRIWGASGQKLSFKVAFSGDKQGTLFFNGTPTYDTEKEEISFPDLTFDIATKNKLLKSAKWLFDDLITSKIREMAHYNIGKDLKTQKVLLEKELNRSISKEIRLKTKINSLQITAIVPEVEKLRISSKATGTFSVLIK